MVATAGLGAACSILLFVMVYRWEQARAQLHFEQHASALAMAIEGSLDDSLQVLQSIESFFDASPKVNRQQFKTLVARMLARHPSIQALEWIPRVPDAERATYEAAARKDGYPHFQFTDRKSHGEMTPAPQRPEYFPVYYVEPYAGNEIALGFDLASNLARRVALEGARDTGNLTATGRITLVQEPGNQFGFLIYAPIYRPGTPSGTVEARREHHLGFALGVFRIGKLVEGTLHALETEKVDLTLLDDTAPPDERFLYGRVWQGGKVIMQTTSGDEVGGPGRLSWRHTFDVAGRQWTIVFRPSPDYPAFPRPWVSWGVLVAGLLLTAALAAYFRLSISRTFMLSNAKESLEKEVVTRKRAEDGLLVRSQQLEAVRSVSGEITRELDLTILLELITQRASELVGAVSGTVYLWDEGAQLLVPRAWRGFGGWRQQGRLSLGEGVAGTVAQRHEGMIVNDYRTSPYARPFFLEHTEVSAVLAEPLLYQDQLLGVITVEHQQADRIFTQEDRHLLKLFAAQAAIAIENARLYEGLQQAAVRLEARVEDRTRELQAANANLEAASRHKSEFLANMSHEIRTPLNSILGFAQLLLEQTKDVLSEKQTRYLSHVNNSGKHLLQLINDILDLSKVEAGKFVLQPEPLPVATTLEDILVIARGLANKKSQKIQADLSPDLPTLQADPVRFKQILFNLLSNAVKFTPDGGRITVTARRGTGDGGRGSEAGPRSPVVGPPHPSLAEDGWLELAVTDTGIGIRAEDFPRLFQEFIQLERTHEQRQEGTGLGLSLTKRLVELHGGRIWAESPGEGQGSTFTVVLPFAGPPAAPIQT